MSDSGAGSVRLDIDGNIASILLDRPAKLNAIDPKMLTELGEIVDQIDRDSSVRVVLVTGAGERAFSVGADIGAWSALDPLDMWRDWVRRGNQILERLATLRQPTIALLNGFTFGGGLELALACDLRIAATGIELAAPEVKIGTFPGWGGTRRLADAIGTSRAKHLVFTGARISPETALLWGLVNEVVAKGALSQRGLEIAIEIAGNAPVAVQLAKMAIDSRGAASVSLEAIGGALSASTADGIEGVAAFREKRTPEFTGK